MNNISRKLPDPVLPEHQLIRDAIPRITLSADLRQRVVTECARQVRLGRWKRRIQLGLSLAAAVCLLLLLLPRHSSPAGGAPSLPGPDPTVISGSPGSGNSRQPGGQIDVADETQMIRPQKEQQKLQDTPVPSREMEQIHFLIDELQQREKRLCAALPWL